MKKITLTLMLYFTIASFFSQTVNDKKIDRINYLKNRRKKIDSLKKIDFLSKEYKYLNKNFSINIDSITFNKGVKDFKFISERINKYSDSLGVVLMIEMKDWNALRIAEFRITYQWKKIGYYIWESEENSKKLGENLGFTHPYRFYEYLYNESINSEFKLDLVKKLKKRLETKLNTAIKTNSYKEFFNLTFKESEQRKLAMELYYEKKGVKNHKH